MAHDLDALFSLLLSKDAGHVEQGLSIAEALHDELVWEPLLERVGVEPVGAIQVPGLTIDDHAGFASLHRLELGRYHPFGGRSGSNAKRESQRFHMVLRLLSFAPTELVGEITATPTLWVDGIDPDLALLARVFPKLESLALTHCRQVELDGLAELDDLRELRLYEVKETTGSTPLAVRRLGLVRASPRDGGPFRNVTDLTTRTAISADALARFRSLQHLRCLGPNGITNRGLEALAALKQLETIHVDGTTKVRIVEESGRIHYTPADIAKLAKLPRLRELVLYQTVVDPHGLEPFIDHPTLKHLALDTKWRRRIPKRIRRQLGL